MAAPSSLRIPLIYCIVSALWIIGSDQVVESLASDPATLTMVQTIKGWAFVLATTLMLVLLLRVDERRERQREGEKEAFFRATIQGMNHILRNFLNQMQLFRMHADKTPDFDREVLALYDRVAEGAKDEIERLGTVEALHSERISQRLIIEPAVGAVRGSGATPSARP